MWVIRGETRPIREPDDIGSTQAVIASGAKQSKVSCARRVDRLTALAMTIPSLNHAIGY